MRSSWSDLMPLPHCFDQRGPKQNEPGPITGPQRLVVNQWQQSGRWQNESSKRHAWSARAALNCGSPGLSQNLWKRAASSGFTSSQSVPLNLAQVWHLAMCPGAGLWRRRVGLATSLLALLIETCRRAPSSLGTTSSSSASGCSSKRASASWMTGSLWRKNGTGTSGTLLAITGAVSSMMSLVDKMQQGSIVLTWQMIAFLEGTAVELFVWFAWVVMSNINKIQSKMAVNGWFATQQTQFLVVGLAVSRFSAFAPVASAKTRDLWENLIMFFLFRFYSPRGRFHIISWQKSTRKHAFGRIVAWFWAHNLSNEGALMLC